MCQVISYIYKFIMSESTRETEFIDRALKESIRMQNELKKQKDKQKKIRNDLGVGSDEKLLQWKNEQLQMYSSQNSTTLNNNNNNNNIVENGLLQLEVKQNQ